VTQASQQLARWPTHAVPCRIGLQSAALLLMLHFVVSCVLVRQHVTKPGFPQTERPAHETTAFLQAADRVPAFTAAFATCFAQWT
jgi:hypothetical protein